MPPAARIADPTTHGTPLAPGPGSTNVFIGFMPAWRATMDQHACPAVNITGADGVGSVLVGSPTVFINNMMACRMGDIVVEKPGLALGPANPILSGCPTVIIGDAAAVVPGAPVASIGALAMSSLAAAIGGAASAVAQALAAASQSGAGTVTPSSPSANANAAGANQNQSTGNSKKVWVEIELLDKAGKAVPNESYSIELPDGSTTTGCTDDKGRARVEGIDPGNCRITFPSLDKSSWRRK